MLLYGPYVVIQAICCYTGHMCSVLLVNMLLYRPYVQCAVGQYVVIQAICAVCCWSICCYTGHMCSVLLVNMLLYRPYVQCAVGQLRMSNFVDGPVTFGSNWSG